MEVVVAQDTADSGARALTLDEAYRRHATLLFRYAVALLGSEPDAEDALHAVFLRLSSGTQAGIADVRSYLVRAVRNECLSRRRSRRRHKTLPLVEDIPGRSTGRAREINRALAKLDAKLREIVILRVYEEMTFDGIAEVTGLSATTVRERYSRALDKLRRELEA